MEGGSEREREIERTYKRGAVRHRQRAEQHRGKEAAVLWNETQWVLV
jgi:hypothetical protein